MNIYEYIDLTGDLVVYTVKVNNMIIYHTNKNINMFTKKDEIMFAIKDYNILQEDIIEKADFTDLPYKIALEKKLNSIINNRHKK